MKKRLKKKLSRVNEHQEMVCNKDSLTPDMTLETNSEQFSKIFLKGFMEGVRISTEKVNNINIEVPFFDSEKNLVSISEQKTKGIFDSSKIFVDIDNIYYLLWFELDQNYPERFEKPMVLGIRECVYEEEVNNLSDNGSISLKELMVVCAENDFELICGDKSAIVQPEYPLNYYKQLIDKKEYSKKYRKSYSITT